MTGLIHIYTGNGKGKTTAALGLCFRALGRGLEVHFIQFMKGSSDYGEVRMANEYPRMRLKQFGRETFVDKENPAEEDIRLALEGLAYAKGIMESVSANQQYELGMVNVEIIEEWGKEEDRWKEEEKRKEEEKWKKEKKRKEEEKWKKEEKRKEEEKNRVEGEGDLKVLMVLDELNVAIDFGLVPVASVMELMDLKPEGMELVITGRGALQEVIDRADYVTEMQEVKHPYSNGIIARKGIEF